MNHHYAGFVREQMPVVGSDGERVGTVDKVEGERIKLTRASSPSGETHHWIALSMVAGVENGEVRLSMPAAQARHSWQGEAAVQSPMGDVPAGEGGPFTGTGGESMAHVDRGRSHGTGEPGPRPDKPLPETPSRDKDRDMRR